jgi:LacI family transcriptional regulator
MRKRFAQSFAFVENLFPRERKEAWKSMATMKDIARQAGVSITTVSHVLNETRFVSEKVQNRVLQAMKELDYQPNILARGLRRGKSHTLGLIVPDVTNPYFAEIARSVEDACAAQGYGVILCNSDSRRERQKNAVEVLASNRVGGLILVNVGMTRREAAIFENLEIPLVMLDREIPGFPVDSIQVDNALGGRQATEHLLSLRHRHIACLGGPSQVSPSSDRVKGYVQALKDAGIEMDPDLIFRGDFTPEGGYRCAQRMMARKKPLPTALFACNDLMAFGAITAFCENRLRIPEDISVVGFDDIRLASYFNPALSTVAQPRQEMGHMAVSLLLERMNQGDNTPNKQVLLKTELRVRESSGAVPGGDPRG